MTASTRQQRGEEHHRQRQPVDAEMKRRPKSRDPRQVELELHAGTGRRRRPTARTRRRGRRPRGRARQDARAGRATPGSSESAMPPTSGTTIIAARTICMPHRPLSSEQRRCGAGRRDHRGFREDAEHQHARRVAIDRAIAAGRSTCIGSVAPSRTYITNDDAQVVVDRDDAVDRRRWPRARRARPAPPRGTRRTWP